MLSTHGVNYLERLFGRRARHSLRMMGGVDHVSIALSGGFRYLLGRGVVQVSIPSFPTGFVGGLSYILCQKSILKGVA
jgi:hypothetical protein